MDPTGFAVGVVGLAGLVSTCIEAFQIIRNMQAFNRNAQTLFTKFDIEKELFISWAQHVGLLKKHTVDRKLFDKRTDKLIYQVLEEIRRLLEEGLGMEGKYSQTLSAHRLERRKIGHHYDDRRSYDNHESGQGKKVSLGRKFMWTVHGKDELNGVINELGYFVGKLNEMIPSIEQRKASLKELKDVGANAGTLSLLMLAEGRTSSGSRYSSDDGDWSDLASEVAGRAEQRRSSGRRKERGGEGRDESPRRRERSTHRRSHQEDEIERQQRRYREHEPERRRESRSSKYSDVSVRSQGSTASYSSSRSTLMDMVGDLIGDNPRPISSFR